MQLTKHDFSASIAGRIRRDWREWLIFLAFAGPNVALFAIFTYAPMVNNLILSFNDWNMISSDKAWVGLQNYIDVFTDSQFSRIFLNTIVFTAASVTLVLALGLGGGLLLNQKLRGRNAARSILFSPHILSGAAIAIVWIYIFDPRFGLIYAVLHPLGIQSPNWLTDPNWSMPAIVIVYVWKYLGYATVIYIAGLQAIPGDLYEAARVDGAGAWMRFRHVTLPGLSPVMFFLVLTSILSSFQSFDIINIMTKGGPINSTNTLIYHLYELGFINFSIGRAGVIGMILFVLMFVVTLLQLRYLDRQVNYA
ncbi:MAG: sugar ABC transporter permease [Chloroflexi bacterium]|nr:sugar ABC transporter permease [Chloroflexota bacterium]